MMDVGEGLVDRMGQQRVRADLHEDSVVDARPGHRRREPDGIAQIRTPVVGVEGGFSGLERGAEQRQVGTPGAQIGQCRTQIGQHGIDDRVVGGDVDLDPPGETILRRHPIDDGIHLFRGAGDDALPR